MPIRIAAGLLFAAAALATAQTTVTLPEAVARALDMNAQLRGARARTEAAEGLRRQAAVGPPLRATLQSENLRFRQSPIWHFTEDTDHFAFVNRLLETGGKRAKRVELASANVRVAEISGEIVRLQIASRVAGAWWAALGAEHERDLMQRSAENFEQTVEYHRNRVREGAAAEVDLLRVQLEHDRIRVAAAAAAQEAERLRIVLLREMGLPPDAEPFTLADDFEDAPHSASPETGVDLSGHPALRLARENVAASRAALELERANTHPDPDLRFGYKRTSGLHTLMAGVDIPLFGRDRFSGQIAAAAAGVRAAEADLSVAETQIRADIATARGNAAARARQITGTLETMRERARETSRIAEAAYREGGTDLLRLLDAERARLDTEVLYFRTLSEYRRSVVELRTAMGLMP